MRVGAEFKPWADFAESFYMANRGVVGVWLVAGLVAALLIGVMWKPFATAWTCYFDWSAGGRESAEVIESNSESGVVLQLTESDGETCVAYLGYTSFEDHRPGDSMFVYRRADRPGRCEIEASIEAAKALLTAVSSVLVVLLLGLILIVKVVTRSITAVPELTTRFDAPDRSGDQPAVFPCPRCAKPMKEGYLPLLSGVHWRNPQDPVGLPTALGGLPGTVSWRGRPRVHAYRCEPCEVLTFRYGGA